MQLTRSFFSSPKSRANESGCQRFISKALATSDTITGCPHITSSSVSIFDFLPDLATLFCAALFTVPLELFVGEFDLDPPLPFDLCDGRMSNSRNVEFIYLLLFLYLLLNVSVENGHRVAFNQISKNFVRLRRDYERTSTVLRRRLSPAMICVSMSRSGSCTCLFVHKSHEKSSLSFPLSPQILTVPFLRP
ncbi:hypothetical protein PUN28_007030 [Cardiocondyla obscurior]|uniref:Uncharacterized protein n=1 Tax=Cardiocondyla obscurior TaxID=286306 RepID=A0AAW2G1N0_9HYME